MWEQAKILMLRLLELLYSLTNSWGIAIILLTILVRIAIHPLTQRQMSSMQKMQKLQPMMKVLQDKYGDDKETLNREMMALYKEHKVSPASGCLPLLIQLPIFILLYGVLYDQTKTAAFQDVTFLTVNLSGSVYTTIADALRLVDESGVRIPNEQLGFMMVNSR